MATFAQMTAYISRRLIDPSNVAVSADDVKESINDAIRYWKYRRFWFNEVNDTATLTAQNPDFPVPSNYLVSAFDDDGFCIEYGGVRYPVGKVTQQVYDANYLVNGYGLPISYARSGSGTYQCFPVPDQNYTVRRHYIKDYDALVNDGDTNDFTTNAARLIEIWALGNLITEIRQDTDMGNYYREASQNEYRQLQVMNDKANGTGKLTLYSNLTENF